MKKASGSQETIISTETIIGAGSGGAPAGIDKMGRREGIGGA